jgi:hypothetical protein
LDAAPGAGDPVPGDADEMLSGAEERLPDPRDGDAARRDLAAEVRDRNADARDHNAEVRDRRVAGSPDPRGVRRWAANDRKAAADDRTASQADRHHAREDRDVARWDLSLARKVAEEHLLEVLNDTDDVAESILLIGQAQGILMNTRDVDAVDALAALEDRATREEEGLQDAARQIIAESRRTAPRQPTRGRPDN